MWSRPKYAGRSDSESDEEDFTRRDQPKSRHSKSDHRHRDVKEEPRSPETSRRHYREERRRSSESDDDREQRRRDKIREKQQKKEEDYEAEEVHHHRQSKSERREYEAEAPIEEENLSDSDNELGVQRKREEIRMRQRHKEIKEEVDRKNAASGKQVS